MSGVVRTSDERLTDRLRMRYPIGPMINGEPEFGWRDFSGPAPEGCVLPTPLMLEAATELERLQADLDLLARSGCTVREYNGHRFVEIKSDIQS